MTCSIILRTFAESLGSLVLVAALSVNSAVYAADLYVSATGVDTGDCLDSLNPCGTIQYAVEVAAPSGDMVHVEVGTYVENVFVTKDITIKGPKTYRQNGFHD